MWQFEIIIILFLFGGFSILFYLLRKSKIFQKKVQEAYETLDHVSTERARQHKKELALQSILLEKKYFDKMEKQLIYSGLPHKYPFLSIEIWLLTLITSSAIVYALGTWIGQWYYGLIAAIADVLVLIVLEKLLAWKNYKAVDNQLLEMVNLLENYSVTAGEVTGVFGQISYYVEEPLKSVLDECFYEAQTSGNSSLALLSAADKIEHPMFKQLIKNLEVCSRYTTDYVELINNSRKELQAYDLAKQERKGLANEAFVNVILLLAMLFVTLILVDGMIQQSIWDILFHTIIGCGALIVVAVLVGFLCWKISTVDK